MLGFGVKFFQGKTSGGETPSFPQQQAGHYKSQISTRITNTNVVQYYYYLSCKPRPDIYVQKLIHA